MAASIFCAFEKPPKILPASLTTVSQCMALAGADHITISPPLLRELAQTPLKLDERGNPVGYSSAHASEVGIATWRKQTEKLTRKKQEPAERKEEAFLDDSRRREEWQMRFEREDGGRAAKKLIDAMNIFCDFQLRLEALMEKYLKGIGRIPPPSIT